MDSPGRPQLLNYGKTMETYIHACKPINIGHSSHAKQVSGLALALIFHRVLPFNFFLSVAL